MIRQLSNLALALSLAASGWGYVLAATLCGHPDCATHVTPVGHVSHAPKAAGEAGERGPHEERAEARDAVKPATAHDSSSGHCGRGPQDEAPSAERNRFTSQRSLASEPRAAQSTSGGAPCGHCVEDSGPQDSSALARHADRPQRDGVVRAAPQASLPSPPSPGFVRDVIPSQGAPPGRLSTYLLNSVFRI